MIMRMAILSALLLATSLGIGKASRTERVPPRQSFSSFPSSIGPWMSGRQEPLPADILAILGVDDYVNRSYQSEAGGTIGLYMGYYGSQQQGDTIHSPQNCLPGAGWQPVSNSYLSVPVPNRDSITVNRYLIEKGLDQAVVLYWYQSHGRVEPNEYWSKVHLVSDALRLNRSDAALVRIFSPVPASDKARVTGAENAAVEFVKAMFPLLGAYLPA